MNIDARICFNCDIHHRLQRFLDIPVYGCRIDSADMSDIVADLLRLSEDPNADPRTKRRQTMA